MQLSSRFARCHITRANHPLQDDQLHTFVPSIYADTAHNVNTTQNAQLFAEC